MNHLSSQKQSPSSSKISKFLNGITLLSLLIALSTILSSCSIVTGIFKTGMGVGIFLVVAVIIIIFVVIAKIGKK